MKTQNWEINFTREELQTLEQAVYNARDQVKAQIRGKKEGGCREEDLADLREQNRKLWALENRFTQEIMPYVNDELLLVEQHGGPREADE